jgi:putative ABC transport system substrate-binding protein
MRKIVVVNFLGIMALLFVFCGNEKQKSKTRVPVVGFLDAFEDETLKQAKKGFFDALNKEGFSEKEGTITVAYKNAQNDFVMLQQSCDLLVSRKVDLLATNSTLSTITAAKKTKDISIFMMVAPSPALSGLSDANGKTQTNLSGVFEDLGYIDTSISFVRKYFSDGAKIGILYNQSEPQSKKAFDRLTAICQKLQLVPVGVSVNNSSETKSAVESLLQKGIVAFFAMPDNTVFASFEIIEKICSKAGIPIFTSEAGLVSRGALCAYGADIYAWGYQSGLMAASYLKNPTSNLPALQIVEKRNKMWNAKAGKNFHLEPFDASFEIVP